MARSMRHVDDPSLEVELLMFGVASWRLARNHVHWRAVRQPYRT